MLAALVAAAPLLVLLVGLPILMKPAAKVAPIALAVTLLIAIAYFQLPWGATVLAAVQGGLFGIFPIMYIPFGALVVYNVLKATGWMDKMQHAMANLTIDRRAQALLIAFGFGAFMEAICGFGAPVAIPASILVGLGYEPMLAALVCLVANTGPVPFGSLAIPTFTLNAVSGLDYLKLSQMTGRLMAPLAFLMSFATVFAMSRWKGVKSALPAILITGLSFSITELLVSNLLGATLTAVLASLVCLAATSFYLSRWKPAVAWRFATDEALEAAPVVVGQKVAVGGGVVTTTSSGGSRSSFHPKELFLAWLPYLLLAVLVILVNLPAGAGGTQPLFAGKAKGWEWMAVKFQIYNPNKLYVFPWLQSPGTIMLIAGLIAAPFLGIGAKTFGQQLGKTARQMIPSFIAVASILAISEVMNLALPIVDPKTKLAIWGALDVKQISIVNTMANAIVAGVANWVYPFIAPVFGAIGVFLTGSNTSSNALFGNLQKFTAHGMGLSDILMASAGNAGASGGKMISPQSLVIAATAVGVLGKEGALMRQTIKYTVPYVLLLGLMTWAYAFVFPGLVP